MRRPRRPSPQRPSDYCNAATVPAADKLVKEVWQRAVRMAPSSADADQYWYLTHRLNHHQEAMITHWDKRTGRLWIKFRMGM